MQEVLHAVVREMPHFEYDRAKGSFRGWLRTILLNRMRDYRRSQRFAGQGEFFDSLLDQLEDELSKISRVWDREQEQHVVACLLRLVGPGFGT